MWGKLLSAFLMMSFAVLVNGADFKPDRTLYVSVKGSDSNDGLSETKAFNTILKASEMVKPGDLVLVKGGIYREKLILDKSGTKEKPIVFRAVPNETVVVTWGWDMNGWKKIDGTRFCYEMSFPYAVNMLWERKTLSRYLELDSMDILDKQPGGFFSDRNSGKIYLHAFDGGIPEASGIVAVPYRAGKKPVSYTGQTSKMPDKFRNAAFAVTGSYNTVEGFEFAFHPMGGLIIGIDGRITEGCAFRNNIVYGCSCGLSIGVNVSNSTIENNFVYKTTSNGILLCKYFTSKQEIRNILVSKNYLFNNGPCPPFEGQFNISYGQGSPYSLASYGDACSNISFNDNTIICDDLSRHYGTMRCKGGIHGRLDVTGNIFIGGGPYFYAEPESSTAISNNTVVGSGIDAFNHRGVIGCQEKTDDGREFKPILKNNLCLKSDKVEAGFADTSFYDYRLRKNSKYTGQGAYPEAGEILYVNASAKEGADGSAPEKALKTLSAAFQKAVSGNCIYILPGTYKENLFLMKKENIALRNYGKGKVVFENSSLDMKECKNLNIDGMIFRNSKVRLKNSDGMEFLHCVFDISEVKAENCGLLKVMNDTFTGNASFDAAASGLVLRNNLFIENKELPVKSETEKTISENNVFSGENAAKFLTEWKNKYNENIPSSTDSSKLNEDYLLPDGSRLAYSGLGWTFIGARGAKGKKNSPSNAEIKVANTLPNSILLQWETPFDYPDARIMCRDKSGRTVYETDIRQSEYKQTVKSECVKGLAPDTEYDFTFIFSNPGVPDKNEKTLSAKTEARKIFQPKTVYVSKTGDDSRNGLSANDAKKTISSALGAASPGDTVLVAPGIYTEQLSITVDGLSMKKPFTLKSEKPGQAVVNVNYLFDFALSIKHGKYITVDGFRFLGMRYAGSSVGVAIINSEGITLRNCIFREEKTGGLTNLQLRCQDSDNIEVSNCIFDHGFQGIWMLNCNNVRVFNNTFWRHGLCSMHIANSKEAVIDIYNNISEDVVCNHNSPAISTGEHGPNIKCDYNIYWKTETECPKQKIYGSGGGNRGAVWNLMDKDAPKTIEETRKIYGVEEHGQFADPLFTDPKNGDFTVKEGSPAIGKGRNGSNAGVDMSVFSKQQNI